MSTVTRKWIVAGVLLLTLLVLLAGTWLIAATFFAPRFGWQGEMMDRAWFGERSFDNRDFASNGERIYTTGTSQTGPAITSDMRGGGFGMGMMRGEMACVECHGENGEGGTVRMMMDTFEVPNIQYEHLTEGEHSEGEPNNGEEEHPPYTDETLKQAITEGRNPAGEQLDWPMPVWDMTDEQVNDLIVYLKTLH